jgi:hypothetical protein
MIGRERTAEFIRCMALELIFGDNRQGQVLGEGKGFLGRRGCLGYGCGPKSRQQDRQKKKGRGFKAFQNKISSRCGFKSLSKGSLLPLSHNTGWDGDSGRPDSSIVPARC